MNGGARERAVIGRVNHDTWSHVCSRESGEKPSRTCHRGEESEAHTFEATYWLRASIIQKEGGGGVDMNEHVR